MRLVKLFYLVEPFFKLIELFSHIIFNRKYFSSDPTDDEDPVVGFLPILKNHVHFLDITNDGLFPKFNPNQKANEFWAEIDHRIQQINAEISKSALKKTLDF